MDKAYQHLRNYRVRHASTGPQIIPASNKAAAGIRAFYFKDPDGHNLEIIYFSRGKGDPRWQTTTRGFFSESITRQSSSRTPKEACDSTAI
jgi:hypothetical protein